MIAVVLVLKKVWEWVKKYWMYLLFPVGLVVGIVSMLGRSKTPTPVVAPELLEAERDRLLAEEEAAKKIREAEAKHAAEIKEIEEKYAATIAKLTQEQKERVEELREDPNELNSFLLSVGKSMRQ